MDYRRLALELTRAHALELMERPIMNDAPRFPLPSLAADAADERADRAREPFVSARDNIRDAIKVAADASARASSRWPANAKLWHSRRAPMQWRRASAGRCSRSSRTTSRTLTRRRIARRRRRDMTWLPPQPAAIFYPPDTRPSEIAHLRAALDDCIAALTEAQDALNGWQPNTHGLHNQINAALAKARAA